MFTQTKMPLIFVFQIQKSKASLGPGRRIPKAGKALLQTWYICSFLFK